MVQAFVAGHIFGFVLYSVQRFGFPQSFFTGQTCPLPYIWGFSCHIALLSFLVIKVILLHLQDGSIKEIVAIKENCSPLFRLLYISFL